MLRLQNAQMLKQHFTSVPKSLIASSFTSNSHFVHLEKSSLKDTNRQLSSSSVYILYKKKKQKREWSQSMQSFERAGEIDRFYKYIFSVIICPNATLSILLPDRNCWVLKNRFFFCKRFFMSSSVKCIPCVLHQSSLLSQLKG